MLAYRRKLWAYIDGFFAGLSTTRTDAAFTPKRPDDQYRLRFANLELAIGKLSDEAALGTQLYGVVMGVQEHVKGQLKGVNVIQRTPKQEQQAREFVQNNVSLIKKTTKEQLGRINNLVSESVAAQWTQDELRKKIQEDFGFTKSRSELIARDQTLRANAEATEQLHRAAGITRFRWLSSQDQRVRHDHKELDGGMYDYAYPPIVDQKTGRRALPGRDFQCRCIAVPDSESLLFGD